MAYMDTTVVPGMFTEWASSECSLIFKNGFTIYTETYNDWYIWRIATGDLWLVEHYLKSLRDFLSSPEHDDFICRILANAILPFKRKFFNDIDDMFRRGVYTGVKMQYDAGADIGMPTGGGF